jgi:hypothetical protein
VEQPVGGHGMGVQLAGVQRRPAAVGADGGVLDQHVGVPLGVAFAAGPVIEAGGGDAASAEPVDAVVAAADPDRLLFQPAQHGPDGHMAGGLDFRPHFRAASGGQQAHAFRIRKRQIEARHPRIDPLAGMLTGFRVIRAIEVLRIPVKDHMTHLLHHYRRDLPSGRSMLELVPQSAAGCQFTQGDLPRGCRLPQRRLQWP